MKRSTPNTIPTRVAAVLPTTEGILLVQDNKDRRLPEVLAKIKRKSDEAEIRGNHTLVERMKYARMIASEGRLSLPGGKIELEDYEVVGATSLLGVDKISTPDQVNLFREVVRQAITREGLEELGVLLEDIKPILEIKGVARNHIICLARAEGTITLDTKELNGLGFLPDKPLIPLNHYFYQAHVRKLYERAMHSSTKNPTWAELVRMYLSRIKVPVNLIQKWFSNITSVPGYIGGLQKYKRRYPGGFPSMPKSNPNFSILNPDGSVAYPPQDISLTSAISAKIIPSDPTKKRQ